MKVRNHAFDLLCGLCIIRMMLNHITVHCGFSQTDWWTAVMRWSYFLMAFFFFKAGYFNKTVSGDSWQFCRRKALNLLVPWLAWGLIGNAVYFFFTTFIFDPKNFMVRDIRLSHLWETAGYYGNGPLWFLFTFFVAYVAMHFIGKVRGLRYVVLLFPAVSWILSECGNPLPLNLDSAFFGIFLFFLGRLWRWVTERMGRTTTALLSAVLLECFVWLNVNYHGQYTMSANRFDGPTPLLTVVAIVCVLCGLSGLLLSVRLPRIPVLGYIGEHSMVFFVAHEPIILVYRCIRSANVRSLRGHWDDYAILIVFVFALCFLLVPHVEKVPWLSGRFPRHKGPSPSQPACPSE